MNSSKSAGAALIPLVVNLKELISIRNLTLFVIDQDYGDFAAAKD